MTLLSLPFLGSAHIVQIISVMIHFTGEKRSLLFLSLDRLLYFIIIVIINIISKILKVYKKLFNTR
jgi:hypothetical protein